MCWSLLNGCWPTQGTPSPPIWVKPVVLRSIHSDMKWQPMPAMAREPSGTLVEVLCGQPEQNQGCLSALTSSTCMAWLLASSTESCASMRAVVSASRPIFFNRLAIAWAISAGVRSAFERSSVWLIGLGDDHSPPLSPSTWSNLPSTRGRLASGQLYSSSFNWYSISWRFSSTTTISCKPSANSRVLCDSKGQTTPTLCTRMPNRLQVLSSKPRSSSACRVSL